jgi:pyrimidine oxygenase
MPPSPSGSATKLAPTSRRLPADASRRRHKRRPDSNINRFKAEGATLPANMVSFIGAYADVAAMLDTMAQIDGVHGVMLVFDDYIEGIEKFGKFIQPLMKSRAGIAKAVA